MKPDSLVIGASKCGSTTLSSLISYHPDIYMVPHEVQFFADDNIYDRGFSWYENLFASGMGHQRLGENSNKYTMKEVYPKAIDRILEYFDVPSLKLVYIVRHPLEMMESFWIEKRSHGGESVHYDFNVAVKEDRDYLLHVANYWQQLSIYFQHFKTEQIHIVFLNELKANRSQVMADCYRFLGVDPEVAKSLPTTHLNQSQGKTVTSPIKSRLRRHLPGYKSLVSLVPNSHRRRLTSYFFKGGINSRPKWNPQIRNWAIQELSEDTQKFLDYCGKPVDYWEMT
jgi:hypothetical protein